MGRRTVTQLNAPSRGTKIEIGPELD